MLGVGSQDPRTVQVGGARAEELPVNELLTVPTPLLSPGLQGYSGSIPCPIYGTALTTPPQSLWWA